MFKFIILLSVINYFIVLIESQNIPQSPCPNIFAYQYDGNTYYGFIQIPSPPLGQSLQLNVLLSLRAQLPTQDVGSLELASSRRVALQRIINGLPTQYKIRFPIPMPLPKLTQITLNQQVICSGQPERGPVVTQIRLEHVLYTEGMAQQQQQQNFNPQINYNQDDNNDYDENLNINTNLNNNNRPIQSNNLNSNNNNNNLFQHPAFTNPQLSQTSNNQIQRPQATVRPQQMIWQNMDSIAQRPKPQQITPTITESTPIQNNGDSILNSLRDDDICGTLDSRFTVTPLVVGGTHIERGTWPWLVAIYTTDISSSLSFKCGGSLISKRVVATAAHCVAQGKTIYNANEVIVYVGRYNIRKWELEEGSVVREAGIIATHPDYMSGRGKNLFDADIAVIVFKTAVQYNEYIRPICLWQGNSDNSVLEGRMGTIVGWGRDEKGQITTPEPKKIQAPIVSESACLRSSDTFSKITSNRTFCAGNQDGTGPCNGDSGSGFAMKWQDKWTLKGLVSIAAADPIQNTCDLKQFVVFTDVAKYVDWLKMFMNV